jgi:hypothetical protein
MYWLAFLLYTLVSIFLILRFLCCALSEHSKGISFSREQKLQAFVKYVMTREKIKIRVFCVGFLVRYPKVGHDCFLSYPLQFFNHSII